MNISGPIDRALRSRHASDEVMKIYCCSCEKDIEADLLKGATVYPSRDDLALLNFWQCPHCRNRVGCHSTGDRRAPLGVIPTPELSKARNHIHLLLDPIWQSGKIKRSELYRILSDRLGWKYHTAKIRSIEEARIVYRLIQQIDREI